MLIANKTVLVTGASRGIGEALVEEALARAPSRCTPPRASLSSIRIGE